jgi:hypothetical protein
MKFSRIIATATIIVGLAACGGSGSADVTATSLVTTTTVSTPDCSLAAVEASVGEPTELYACSSNWAALQTSSYVGSCGECEAVLLYKWSDTKWSLMGSCSQYSPLVPSGVCSGMSGPIKDKVYTNTMADFPPKEVACALWTANRYPENVAETGCTPDPAN